MCALYALTPVTCIRLKNEIAQKNPGVHSLKVARSRSDPMVVILLQNWGPQSESLGESRRCKHEQFLKPHHTRQAVCKNEYH